MDYRILLYLFCVCVVTRAQEEQVTKKSNPLIDFFEAPLKAFNIKQGEAVAVFEPQVVQNNDNNTSSFGSWLRRPGSISIGQWLRDRNSATSTSTTTVAPPVNNNNNIIVNKHKNRRRRPQKVQKNPVHVINVQAYEDDDEYPNKSSEYDDEEDEYELVSGNSNGDDDDEVLEDNFFHKKGGYRIRMKENRKKQANKQRPQQNIKRRRKYPAGNRRPIKNGNKNRPPPRRRNKNKNKNKNNNKNKNKNQYQIVSPQTGSSSEIASLLFQNILESNQQPIKVVSNHNVPNRKRKKNKTKRPINSVSADENQLVPVFLPISAIDIEKLTPMNYPINNRNRKKNHKNNRNRNRNRNKNKNKDKNTNPQIITAMVGKPTSEYMPMPFVPGSLNDRPRNPLIPHEPFIPIDVQDKLGESKQESEKQNEGILGLKNILDVSAGNVESDVNSDNLDEDSAVTDSKDEERSVGLNAFENPQQFIIPQSYFPLLGSNSYLEVSSNGRFLLKSGRELKFIESEQQALEEDKKSEDVGESANNLQAEAKNDDEKDEQDEDESVKEDDELVDKNLDDKVEEDDDGETEEAKNEEDESVGKKDELDDEVVEEDEEKEASVDDEEQVDDQVDNEKEKSEAVKENEKEMVDEIEKKTEKPSLKEDDKAKDVVSEKEDKQEIIEKDSTEVSTLKIDVAEVDKVVVDATTLHVAEKAEVPAVTGAVKTDLVDTVVKSDAVAIDDAVAKSKTLPDKPVVSSDKVEPVQPEVVPVDKASDRIGRVRTNRGNTKFRLHA